MARKKSDTGLIQLGASGDTARKQIAGSGHYIHCYASEGLLILELWRDNQQVEEHTVRKFVTLNNRNFDQFVVRNDSGEVSQVRFFYGVGDYTAPQEKGAVIIDGINAAFDLATGVVPMDDVIAVAGQTTQILVGHVDNVRVRVTNPDLSPTVIRIGLHDSVAVNNGSPLLQGATYQEQTNLGVWVHNSGGADIALPVEVLRNANS